MAASHTTQLGLNKPARTDFVSVVSDINDNMDMIDAMLDDTAGDGDTTKVWSANKVHDELANKADVSSPEFLGSISLNRKGTAGNRSIAVGFKAQASGDNSQAFGDSTEATGEDSHAEGYNSEANGFASHVEGEGTVANGDYQHVSGMYNVPDSTSLEIIGNGEDDENLSNARLLDANGNERLKGDLYVGCDADSTGGHKVPYVDDTAGIGTTDKVWSAEKAQQEEDKKANVIYETQNNGTFTDGADDMPLKTLNVGIVYVQDLRGYENPWIGGVGKNLFDPVTMFPDRTASGLKSEVQADGSIHITGESSGVARYNTSSPSITLPAGTYKVSGDPRVVRVRGNGEWLDTNTDYGLFTLAEETDVQLGILVTNGETYDFYEKIQLEVGSTATDWVPYENICPISGWTGCNINVTGKNLFPGFIAGMYWETDGTESEKSTTAYAGSNRFKISGSILNLKCFSDTFSTGSIKAYFWNSHYSLLGGSEIITGLAKNTNVPINVPTGAEYVAFRLYRSGESGGVAPFVSAQIMLSYEDEQFYEAYNGNVYAVTFPQTAGAVYGGTLTVNRDGTGSLVVDHCGYVFDGTEDITGNSSGSSRSLYFVNENLPLIYGASASEYAGVTVCSHLPVSRITSSNTVLSAWVGVTNNKDVIWFRTPDIQNGQTNAGFATWLAGQATAGTPVTVVFKIATPIPYTLTVPQVKTLLGNNIITADTGSISSISYPADTKTYIDNLFNSITNAEGVSF